MGEKNENIIWESRKHFMWFPISFTKYSLDSTRLYLQTGLLTTHYDELLLYRIVDCKCTINLIQRLFGTGTVTVIGYDTTTPILELKNIKNPIRVKDLLSQLIVANRSRSNIVEFG